SRFTLSTSCLPLPSFLLILPRQLISTLFPYTTLFRSVRPVFKRRTGWKISGRTALEWISGGKENEYYRNRRSRFHRFQLYFSHVKQIPGLPDHLPGLPDLCGYSFHSCPGHGQSDFPFCEDRKSTRMNSSHVSISYAVFCLYKIFMINVSCMSVNA